MVNGVPVASLSSNTNSSGSNVTSYYGSYSPSNMSQTSWQISPTNPGAGSRMDITVGGTASWSGDQNSYVLYINNRDSQNTRSISSITAYEIAQ